MSLLNEIIKDLSEDAAGGSTGAGAIAAVPGGMQNSQSGFKKKKSKRLTKIDRLQSKERATHPTTMIRRAMGEAWQGRLSEMIDDENTFDAADVNSKLDAAEQRSRMDDDTVPFGMEDEDGQIVKVYVRIDQADEFEVALGAALAGDEEDDYSDEETGTDSKEIAEVLFSLKDKFDIVDVEWPKFKGDEEEETEMAASEADMDVEGAELDGGEGAEGAELEGGELEAGEGEDLEAGALDMEPDGGTESTLQAVIDMMKADAEARTADANARTKEAEARAAEANASSAASKVEQEEQILDMEAYDKSKKTEKGEAERLAKLAKYQHELSAKDSVKQEEEEEDADSLQQKHEQDGTITKSELGSMIQKYLAAAN